MEIFYKDLMKNFNNKNLREKLIELVDENKIIVVKGLNSGQRYQIYRQMYYPLKFEKIILNENNVESTVIRIYNSKVINKLSETENETEKSDEEKNEIEELDESYSTDDDEQSRKIEDIANNIFEKLVEIEKSNNKIIIKVNFLILFNIVGWIILYILDPVRLIKTIKMEYDTF